MPRMNIATTIIGVLALLAVFVIGALLLGDGCTAGSYFEDGIGCVRR